MEFGDHDEVHYEPSLTNSTKSRTPNVLGLVPTGNIQGSYKFLGLTTGKKLKKQAWKSMPMPDAITKIV